MTSSALPPLQRQLAERLLSAFCEARVPVELRDKVRFEYGIRGTRITLRDCRPHWRDASQPWSHMPVAQMRFDPEEHTWALFWADRNGKWILYDPLPPAKKLEDLIEEIDVDPHGAFWG
jgi:Protein of unknown function (DUF3024)